MASRTVFGNRLTNITSGYFERLWPLRNVARSPLQTLARVLLETSLSRSLCRIL